MANWKFFLDNNEVEEPIGWDAIEFTAIRMESHGIDQPFSTEVKFYAEGARYIKSIYDQFFINQPIAIQITSDVGLNGNAYEFNGFLNMAIYQEQNVCDTDSWEVTVGIVDDQFREEFKSRMDVEVNLLEDKDLDGNAITPADWENIRLHRSDLYIAGTAANLSWSNMELRFDADFDITCACCEWVYPNYIGTFPVYWQNSEFENPVGSTFDVTGTSYGDSNVIFKNNTDQARTINFKYDLSGIWVIYWPSSPQYSINVNWDAIFRIHDGSGGNSTYHTVYSSPLVNSQNGSPPNNTPYSFSGNISLTIPPYYVVAFLGYWGDNPGATMRREVSTNLSGTPPLCRDAWINIYTERLCLIATELNSGEFASFCDVLRMENYFKRIIQKLTGSANKLISDTFSKEGDGCYWNNAITNGLRIRNAITFEQASTTGCGENPEGVNQSIFNTSWKKSFEEIDKIFCLGWAFEWTGSEWKVRLEKRDYFYQNQISYTFENVGEITQYALADKLVNHVITGYSDNWKNQNIGGAWAINTERNYFIANKALNKNSTAKLDLRSEVIAEGYAIEFSRRLQFYEPGPISSDRPNDYELFIIWMNRVELTGSAVQNTPLQLQDETGAYTFAPGTVSYPSDFIAYTSSPRKGLYNIYHTPARLAYRWWKVLGMHTYGLTNPRLRFQTGEYQVSYASTVSYQSEDINCIEQGDGPVWGGVVEDWDVTPELMGVNFKEYLFKPIEVEFSYPQSLCDFLTLSQDEQYKKVRLTSGSLTIEGFIQEATNQPEDASGGTTKFRLLVSNQQSQPGGAFDEGYDDGYLVGG